MWKVFVIFESGKWKPILGNNFFQVDFTITILIQNPSYSGLAHHRPRFFRLFTQPVPVSDRWIGLVLMTYSKVANRPITAVDIHCFKCLFTPRKATSGKISTEYERLSLADVYKWTRQRNIKFIQSAWIIFSPFLYLSSLLSCTLRFQYYNYFNCVFIH